MTAGEFMCMLCRVGNPEDTLRFLHGNSELEPVAIDINFDGRELVISLEEIRDLSDQAKHEDSQ